MHILTPYIPLQVLADHTKEGESTRLEFMRFYRCINPMSTFMTCWTMIFVTFVAYISTVGLIINTFDLDLQEPCAWSPLNWLDFAIDTFFVLDVVFCALLFGQTIEYVGAWYVYTCMYTRKYIYTRIYVYKYIDMYVYIYRYVCAYI